MNLWQALTRGGLAAILLSAPVLGAERLGEFGKAMPKDRKAHHALNRLAFGPRPGEVERVRRIGVEKWVEEQLHPERIRENAELARRLAPLDTLPLSASQMLAQYPAPQILRAMAQGRLPYPADPELRKRFEILVRQYQRRQRQQSTEPPPGGEPEEPRSESERARERSEALARLLSPQERRTFRRSTREERLALLASLDRSRQIEIFVGLPRNQQMQILFAGPDPLRQVAREYAPGPAVIQSDLVQAKLYRAVYSERQLEEVLTDFWFNHFNVFLNKGADRYLVTSYERDAIRPHVLGKFQDLLAAVAKSPAMLFYLDNWQSVDPKAAETLKTLRENRNRRAMRRLGLDRLRGLPLNQFRGLNENYGRELLELHTLGVDGGYTQRDVVEVARCFTGWSIGQPFRNPEFQFHDFFHDKGEKSVLGVKIPAGGGLDDGTKVLEIVAHHPATARFLSKKLAQRFVADEPPQALVDRMAREFQRTGGDLRAVLKTLLSSKEFWSEGAYQSKMKSPLELVASAVRATGAEVAVAAPLARQIAELGQPLYAKQEPTGYYNNSRQWVSSAGLVGRMNFALKLAGGRVPGVTPSLPVTGNIEELAQSFSMPAVSPDTRAAIESGLTNPAPDPRTAGLDQAALTAGLLLGSPEFQRR